MKARLLAILMALAALLPGLEAQGAVFSGSLDIACSQTFWNPGYLGAQALTGVSGMGAAMIGDMALSVKGEDSGLFYLNADVSGSLAKVDTGSGAMAAPLGLSVRQCYFQIPLGAAFLFAAGKKNKSIGCSSFFNVSNRLTPRSMNSQGESESAIGMAEADYFVSDFLSIEALGYFSGIDAWEKTSGGLGVKLQLEPLNADLYEYLEEWEHPYFGYGLTLQLGRFQLYGEGMLSEELSIEQAAGVCLSIDRVNLRLEYLYRSDGSTTQERMELVASLEGLASQAETGAALEAHYAALEVDSELVPDLVKSNMSFMLSAGPDAADWERTLGARLGYRLTFVPKANFSASCFMNGAWGGDLSERTLFEAGSLSAGLYFSYAFSSR